MKLNTVRAKQLDIYIKDPSTKLDQKVRVELAGEVKTLQVYKIPINYLIYNIRNGRFAAELLAKEERLNRKLDASVAEDAKMIQDLLLKQNESETEALKDDLRRNGQLDPGIITFDGAVINANRRMAILSLLFDQAREPKFQYLNVARLPQNVDEKDLWRIEAGLQFAKDFRLEYGPVNELLKLKEGINRGLTPKDISRSLLGRYTPKKVDEKLEILKLIESYLEFIGKPGEYYLVQDERNVEKFNSLQSIVVAPLKRNDKNKSEIAKLGTLAFLMIEKTDFSHWDIRKLNKIANEQKATNELMKVYNPRDPRKIPPDALVEAFKAAEEIVDDREQRDKPERLIKKALSAIQSIDPKSSKLREPSTQSLLNTLKEEVDTLHKSTRER